MGSLCARATVRLAVVAVAEGEGAGRALVSYTTRDGSGPNVRCGVTNFDLPDPEPPPQERPQKATSPLARLSGKTLAGRGPERRLPGPILVETAFRYAGPASVRFLGGA